MIRQIVADLEAGQAQTHIAARFHHTLVAAIVEVCRRMRTDLAPQPRLP
jgi:hydrogenase maturation factor HypF (carbamoyltransferase family)